jgi:hypothetical protein
MINCKLPVEIVLAPEWWHRHVGIIFDHDFFFHPVKRVESEQKMEKVLYERWGNYGLGANKDETRPELGAVHLAAGFLLSEMMGCKVEYKDSHSPQVIPANREDFSLDLDDAFKSEAFKRFLLLKEKLKEKYGYLTGDVNWSGILNLALDVRGEEIFTDLMISPEEVRNYFVSISELIDKFVSLIQPETGTSSISVNRNVRHFVKPVFLHSECSHTMISTEDYESTLMEFDIEWSKRYRPFGIHYCGNDPHRHAKSFAKIPHLDFLDLGWGGDVKILREHLPNTFFNLRLSPVKIIDMTVNEIRDTIIALVRDSGNPYLTGVCCINMDDTVTDEKINAIFETVYEIRENS